MARKRRRNNKRNMPRGWDALADWYNGWVGKGGSEYHRQLAIPELLKLLDPKKDEMILDVGAGQGVLAPFIHDAGAHYVGVDVSAQLLDYGRQHHQGKGRFVQSDAAQMHFSSELTTNTFNAAVFLLSIQDMDPLEGIIASTKQMLTPTSRIVILMTHPAFRIPRQSGWGFDENRKLQYRRIDRYITPLPVPVKNYANMNGKSISFHRPIQDYVNTLSDAGFYTTRMHEITIDKNFSLKKGRSSAEIKADAEIPIFLALRANSFIT